MQYRRLIPVLFWLAGAVAAWANLANGDPRKEKLYAMFIAPCCWRENLLVHHSPKADELRVEIDTMIAAGQSGDAIKAELVRRHSLRILALPVGVLGRWLDWATPLLALCGAAAVYLFIRRSLRSASPQPATPAGSLPDLPESDW